MIFIENNKNNAIVLQVSKNINMNSEFIFEFIHETTKSRSYYVTINMTNNVADFDLFELEESSTITKKQYYFNEPINLDNGQYTCYVYKCENLPTTIEEIDAILIQKKNKIYATKMVVELDTETVSNINKKYL